MIKTLIFSLLLITANLVHSQFDSTGIVSQQASIRNNAPSYINQPYSLLYNALAIKPKSVSGFARHNNKNFEYAHKFYYQTADSLRQRNLYIYIEWDTPIPDSETHQYQLLSLRDLSPQENSIYTNKIIRKLQLFPDPAVDKNSILIKSEPPVKETKK